MTQWSFAYDPDDRDLLAVIVLNDGSQVKVVMQDQPLPKNHAVDLVDVSDLLGPEFVYQVQFARPHVRMIDAAGALDMFLDSISEGIEMLMAN